MTLALSKWPEQIASARTLLIEAEPAVETWALSELLGRFVELSGAAATAALTIVAQLIAEAQRRSELAAWIGSRAYTFYPPDFAAAGIDLAALPVVHATDVIKAARAADALIRSGGFAIVVMDLGYKAELPMPVQTRLVGLAKKHRTALVCITRHDDDAAPLGSLVSIRGETEKHRTGFDCFDCALHIVKDKRHSPGWAHTETCRGADGLC